MTSKERAELGKKVLHILPGFVVKGPLTFLAPIDNTLRGIFFDRSSDVKTFYVYVFYLPLIVPRDFFSFTFGKRLRTSFGREAWQADMPDLDTELIQVVKNEALPYLDGLDTPRDAAATIARTKDFDNSHVQEAFAYYLILAGETDVALRELDNLIERVRVSTHPGQWVQDLGERAKRIKTKLLSDPNDAKAQLAEWRKETLGHLKLEQYAEEVYTP